MTVFIIGLQRLRKSSNLVIIDCTCPLEQDFYANHWYACSFFMLVRTIKKEQREGEKVRTRQVDL